MKTTPLQKLTRLTFHCLALPVLMLATSGLLRAESVEMNLPAGNYAKQLGSASLKDPSGVSHTKQEVKNKVVVGIFSDPTMSQGDAQEKWSDLLATQPASKVSDKVALILVEDMTEAGMFRGMALNDMKKDFTPEARPFLILDNTGAVFKRFGVARNKTVILIYDKHGKLRDVEEDLTNQDLVIHRIKVITKKLMAE